MLGLKHWSKIIDSAARSQLGIVALAILAISGIIGLLLSNSEESGEIRLIAFSGAVGAILILAVLVVARSANQSAPTTHHHHPQYQIVSTIATVGIILMIVLMIVAAIWGLFYFALIIGFAPGGWQFFQAKPSIGLRDLAIYNTVTLIPFLLLFGIFIAIIILMLSVTSGNSDEAKGLGCIVLPVVCALLYFGAGFIIMLVVSFGNIVLYGDERVVVVNKLHASLTYYAITLLFLLIFGPAAAPRSR
jgi:hypothetical protein